MHERWRTLTLSHARTGNPHDRRRDLLLDGWLRPGRCSDVRKDGGLVGLPKKVGVGFLQQSDLEATVESSIHLGGRAQRAMALTQPTLTQAGHRFPGMEGERAG